MHTHSGPWTPPHAATDAARAYGGVSARAANDSAKKDAFLAMLGHELRNLLSPLSFALKLLEHGAADPQLFNRALPVAQRQVEHMSYLVDELLDVGRVLNDHLFLECQRIDLRDLMRQTLQACEPWLQQHAVELDLCSEPLWVEGDSVRLTQVLTNLLHNAAKFTPLGGRIEVAAWRDGCMAAFRVSDTGAGIAGGELENIFTMFAQERRVRDQSREGLGVGLALVRRLVEVHRGRVLASSEGPGKGAAFTVRLPLARQV